MRRQEQGFTLIELVMVIVILGILAAVAIPRYLNLTSESQIATRNAAVSSTGSAIAIAAARNRNVTVSPAVSHVEAEIPGAACALSGTAAVMVHGRVNVTLFGSAYSSGSVGPVVTIGSCAGASTFVASVGTGHYSV